MRALSFVLMGVVGTIAYQRISEHQPMISKEMHKMMKHNTRHIRKIREIF